MVHQSASQGPIGPQSPISCSHLVISGACALRFGGSALLGPFLDTFKACQVSCHGHGDGPMVADGNRWDVSRIGMEDGGWRKSPN